ncbi:hypothetical protein EFR92_10500 [Lentilactobacillus buchneri]|uniref:hypothetical protein n=1 Tax=Lentilactobacillus buchneri TaxID=1581 RepID=UPI0021A64730|nr:hypothetical protein [Lentilactobacillus buchneri]MCT3545823.1 hypothetical protein [Lentilactobacillus buchneri]
MFNWETFEPDEYSRDKEPSFVDLTTRSYVTAEGHATQHTDDPDFLRLSNAAAEVAKTISGGPGKGIPVEGFKEYRPYPVQAVWTDTGDGEDFKIWIKQPLFINEKDFDAALTQIDFSDFDLGEIKFEHLAEGIEIQIVNTGAVTPDSEALKALENAIQKEGFTRLHGNEHREVYIDGLPVDSSKVVLVRLAIDANGKELPGLVHN